MACLPVFGDARPTAPLRDEFRSNGADNMRFGNLPSIIGRTPFDNGVESVLVIETLIKPVSDRANDDDAPSLPTASFIKSTFRSKKARMKLPPPH